MNINRVNVALSRLNGIIGYEKFTLKRNENNLYVVMNDNEKALLAHDDLLRLHHELIAMAIGAEEYLSMMKED